MMMNVPRRFRAFTLIELLVVIAIIVVLAGLMFPVTNGVLNMARKTTAKNDAVQIANAVMMYETEYGRFPPVSGTNVDGALLNALIGVTNSTFLTNNPRGIVFLEVGNWKKGRGGIVGSDDNIQYLDPWSNVYHIVMDTNYTNEVRAPVLNSAGNGMSNAPFRKRVVVWNKGTDQGSAAFNKKFFVNSAE